MLSALMLIFPTPQYPFVITAGLVIPSLLALFLSIERPEKAVVKHASAAAVTKHSRGAVKRHYRRYLAK